MRYKYLMNDNIQKERCIWEVLLDLANWKYYIFRMKEHINKQQREPIVEEVIDKLSMIRFLIEDVKKYIILKGIKNTEKETVARILSHAEEGILSLNEKIKLLF